MIGGDSTDLQIKISKYGTSEPEQLSRLSKTQGKSGPCPGGLNPPLWALLGHLSQVARTAPCGGGEVLDLGVHEKLYLCISHPPLFFLDPVTDYRDRQNSFYRYRNPAVFLLFVHCLYPLCWILVRPIRYTQNASHHFMYSKRFTAAVGCSVLYNPR